MNERPNLAAEDALDAAMVAGQSIVGPVGATLLEGGTGVPSYWIERANDPGTVCIKRDGGCWVAWVGPEPENEGEYLRERSALGNSGKGFCLVDADCEPTVTHNLWSDEFVPAEYHRLFRPTHGYMLKMSLRDSNEYWASKFDPFGEGK